jgi:hypothetical protein
MISITIEQPAKWRCCGGSTGAIEEPAIIEIDGVKLMSAVPTNAKQAETINDSIERLVNVLKKLP